MGAAALDVALADALLLAVLVLVLGFQDAGVDVVAVDFHHRDLATDKRLDVAQLGAGLARDERNGEADLACAARAADAMDVVLGHVGQVVVHDVVDAGNVDAAS